jgi:hypothetical protein
MALTRTRRSKRRTPFLRHTVHVITEAGQKRSAMRRVPSRVMVFSTADRISTPTSRLLPRHVGQTPGTMRGIDNYHPGHLIQALDFCMGKRKGQFPFKNYFRFNRSISALKKADPE